MSVSSIRTLIYNVVNNVADVGQVHDYYRHGVDESAFLDIAKTTIDSTDQIRVWMLTFLGWDYEDLQPHLGRNDKGLNRIYHFRVDGWLGVDDSAETEKTFSVLAEAVCESINGSSSINTSGVCLYRNPVAPTIDFRLWVGKLCHHAEILVDIAEDSAQGRYLFHDTFTGTGNLSAHTPDVDRKGNGWTDAGGNTLSGGYVSGSWANPPVVDVEESDCTVELVGKDFATSASSGYIIGRYSDSSNNWRVGVDRLADVLEIIEYDTSVETVRATVGLSGFIDTDIVRAVFTGSTVIAETVQSDGTLRQRIRYDSATFNQTETSFGCGNGSGHHVDEIRIYWAATDD